MSRDLECLIVEGQPHRWYAVVEDGTRRDNEGERSQDWLKHAYCHGPLASQDLASAFAGRRYRPGGEWVMAYPIEPAQPDLMAALARAEAVPAAVVAALTVAPTVSPSRRRAP